MAQALCSDGYLQAAAPRLVAASTVLGTVNMTQLISIDSDVTPDRSGKTVTADIFRCSIQHHFIIAAYTVFLYWNII